MRDASNEPQPLDRCQPNADSLVDRAVEDINRIYRHHSLEAVRAIGQYVLDAFFDGDPTVFAARAQHETSYRLLARREDLHVSAAFLSRSVALLEHFEQFPRELWEGLTFTHHRILLPVDDVEGKLRLARLAVEQGLKSRELEVEVRRYQESLGPRSRAGRPPLPRLRKAVDRLCRSLESLVALTKDGAIDGHSDEVIRQAISVLQFELVAMKSALDRLQAAAGRNVD